MIPESWRHATYGELLVETQERAGEGTALPVLSVTKTRGPMLASERFGKVMHGRDLAKYRVARRNSIVADPMLLWDGSIGIQAVADAGLVSPDYRVYECRAGCIPKFMAHLVRSSGMLPHYQGGARGTNVRRNRIARSDFLLIPLVLPPPAEQQRIAAVLDSVDQAIATSERVLQQLEVVRHTLLATLLSRGVPGRHHRMKHSHLGPIPEEWQVVAAEEVFADGPTNGRSPPSRTAPPGVRTFSIGAVRNGRVRVARHLKFADIPLGDVASFVIKAGEILIVRGNGNPDLVGRCGIVEDPPDDCIYPDILMRVRLKDAMLPRFFVALWNSEVVREQILDRAKTTNGTYKINSQDVRSTLLLVPSVLLTFARIA